jgi:stage II sporulation protein D
MRLAAAALLAALILPAGASAGTVFLLDGRGWGHGVGMSQWGAEGYARHGYSATRILAHYYPHTVLQTRPARDVRVLLGLGKRSVRVGSARPFLVVDARGAKVHVPAGTITVDSRLVVRHRRLAAPLRIEPGAEPLMLPSGGYRGDLLVDVHGGKLTLVNELPLDLYLRGVVPSEVPRGWHEAAYRAQAVAARSYTLATLHPGADFDLYPDQRSQMYGGIRAERPETNAAVDSTAGQVLTYDGAIIPAYYFSTSGGRTSSIHDAWPWARQVPYLVSVRDPYDYISPRHAWPTRRLTPAQLGVRLGLAHVTDAVVVTNSSGRAAALRVRADGRWRRFSGAAIRKRLHLDSTDFDLSAMTIEAPSTAVFDSHALVRGWVRGLGTARLQEDSGRGWQTIARLHPSPNGHFRVSVPAGRSTRLRLAYNDLPGPSVTLPVTPRVTVSSRGTRLRVRVAPSLPLQVQRLSRNAWRAVVRSTGSFAGTLRPGRYRVTVPARTGFAAATTRALGLRTSGAAPE